MPIFRSNVLSQPNNYGVVVSINSAAYSGNHLFESRQHKELFFPGQQQYICEPNSFGVATTFSGVSILRKRPTIDTQEATYYRYSGSDLPF